MQCPVCKSSELTGGSLEAKLDTRTCPSCLGHWLTMQNYLDWRERNDVDTDVAAESAQVQAGQDSKAGKLCPHDGGFLIRHKVGRGLGFHIDQCGHCGGTWLDQGEWQRLRTHRLHDQLHLICTDAWQSEVQREQLEQSWRARLRDNLGQKDLAEIQRIKQWLDEHPKSHELYAFLLEQRGQKSPGSQASANP